MAHNPIGIPPGGPDPYSSLLATESGDVEQAAATSSEREEHIRMAEIAFAAVEKHRQEKLDKGVRQEESHDPAIFNQSLLDAAARGERVEVIEDLLLMGARPLPTTREDRGTLDYAILNSTPQVVELLLKARARPSVTYFPPQERLVDRSRYFTYGSLDLAICQNHPASVVRSLLEANAQLSTTQERQEPKIFMRGSLDLARSLNRSDELIALLQPAAAPRASVPVRPQQDEFEGRLYRESVSDAQDAPESPRFCACLDDILPAFLVSVLENVSRGIDALYRGIAYVCTRISNLFND